MTTNPLPLLVFVENHPEQADLLRAALVRCGIACRLVVAESAEVVQGLLDRGTAPSASAPPRPALVLLDLDLPAGAGQELLRRLKDCPSRRSIPLVVISSSGHPRDIEAAYRSQANAYHVKHSDHVTWQRVLDQVLMYWLGAAAPPPSTVPPGYVPAAKGWLPAGGVPAAGSAVV